MNILIKGENALFDIVLQGVNYTDLITVSFQLKQGSNIRAAYTLADDELRQGGASNVIRIELTEAVSNSLNAGLLIGRLRYTTENNNFQVDDFEIDIDDIQLATIR